MLPDKPVCLSNQRLHYGMSEGETEKITCTVESLPPPDTFNWMLNTSTGRIKLSKNAMKSQVI